MNIEQKLREIALDLREITKLHQIEHQAVKLDKVIEAMGWQPIGDTRFENGEEALISGFLFDKEPQRWVSSAEFRNGKWWGSEDAEEPFYDPTHWKPLPTPPSDDPDAAPAVHGSGTGED